MKKEKVLQLVNSCILTSYCNMSKTVEDFSIYSMKLKSPTT